MIRLAKAAADQLPSPPRIYERDSSRAQDWPGQAGSLPASLDICGAMMAAEDNLGCTPPLTLTLSLNSTDGTTIVTFQSDWQSAAGPKTHSWQFSVQRSRRKATFLKEEGDPLPVLPLLAGGWLIAGLNQPPAASPPSSRRGSPQSQTAASRRWWRGVA